MPRFILRYQGTGAMPKAAVEQLQALPESRILDQSARMLLMEGPADDISTLARTLPDWSCIPEKTIPLPKTRPSIKAGK